MTTLDPWIRDMLDQVLPKHEQDAFLDEIRDFGPNAHSDTARGNATSGCPACRHRVMDLLEQIGAQRRPIPNRWG